MRAALAARTRPSRKRGGHLQADREPVRDPAGGHRGGRVVREVERGRRSPPDVGVDLPLVDGLLDDHATVRTGMTVGELATECGRAGGRASRPADFHRAVDITAEMPADDVTTFLGIAGVMVPAGPRTVIVDLIRDGRADEAT